MENNEIFMKKIKDFNDEKITLNQIMQNNDTILYNVLFNHNSRCDDYLNDYRCFSSYLRVMKR